jgi:hypothetical protein
LPEGPRGAFLENYLTAACNHPDIAVRHHIQNASEAFPPESAVRMALLGAATSGTPIFVRSRLDAYAFEIRLPLWEGEAALVVNPVTLALTGRLVFTTDAFPGHALERDLANADLYLRRSDLNKLLGRRGAGPGILRKAAQQMIEDFRKRRPHERMIFARFVQEMRGRYPDAGVGSLRRVWSLTRPPEWGRGGRPPGPR